MMHRSLNNAYARSPCAYCKHHKCSLTVKQVRQKNCLGKQCWHLVKYRHEWWTQRDAVKQKKKQNKKGEINMANIKVNKNAVEIRSELKADGTKIEYVVIDGQKIGIMGSANEADRAAAIKALNAAYVASNGNIYEMMQKLSAIATMEEKEIEPDEMVEVCGVEVIMSYSKAKAYTMDGEEIANCGDLPAMPKEAVKAMLMARAEIALN